MQARPLLEHRQDQRHPVRIDAGHGAAGRAQVRIAHQRLYFDQQGRVPSTLGSTTEPLTPSGRSFRNSALGLGTS